MSYNSFVTFVVSFVTFVVCATGQAVLDTLLPPKSHKNCRILSIKPIAVPLSERAQFLVKGFNLSWSTTRYPTSVLHVH